ncbi:calmodulin binding protein PICBP-like isoform X3 [Quercus lobata]|uniref:calmodulin binding protein PICBP-like isoform X3 n=1 Tax=Quercus lobata TaxID=97700 RepID=UPI0012462F9F|nr:calmodulin binding protein PICBP-like isoform X3 [Quercus lobata]
MLSLTNESSFYQNQESSDMGGTEPKKKLKKLRSVKLSRLPSLRSSTRRAKSRSNHLPIVLSANVSSSGQSTPFEMSDGSPNFVKATSSADAKKETSQNSVTRLIRRSSFKPGKSLTRMSSLRYKRPLMSKSSGGTELQRKLKKSRSMKKASFKGSSLSTRSTESGYQASPHTSESSFSSNGQIRKKTRAPNPKPVFSGNKSVRIITRTSSLKPMKVLTKMGTFKSKKNSMGRCSNTCQISDSSMRKATCSSTLKNSKFPVSSTLKNSKFPVSLELLPGGHESERNSIMKVCPYTYCSLHGHHHNDSPPLKRFISTKRSLLKTQKSMKRDSQFLKGSRSGNMKKGIQKNKMVHNGDPAARKSRRAISPIEEKAGRDFTVDIYAEPEATSNAVATSGGKDEEVNSILTDDMYNGDSESFGENFKANCLIVEPPDGYRRPILDRFVESTGSNSVVSSDIDHEPMEEEITGGEEKKGCSNDVEGKRQFKNQKYIRMWRLLYKHAVVGIDGKVENQHHLDGVDSEEQVEDGNNLLGMNNSSSSEDFSETNEDTAKESHDTYQQRNELSQIDAIKLVQEAVDNVLLQDFQDNSTDDQSITSSTSSDQELLGKSHGEGGDRSMSDSSEPAKDSMIQDTKAIWLNINTISTPKDEKAASEVGNKSDKKMPKGWSNLKRIILLKRFVKALEKVRNFKPRGPRYLSLKPDPEAEKVNLRRQTTDERKNTEEWMLDHALQQVISKLAPAQKQKVALLVEAFEKVLPLQEIETSQRSNAAVCTRANSIQSCNGFSIQSGEETCQERSYEESAENLPRKTSYLEKEFKDYPDQVGDFLTDKQQTPVKFSELGADLESCCIKTEHDILASQATKEDWKEKKIVAINLDKVDNKFILADDLPDSINSCSPEVKVPSSCDEFSLKPEDIVSTCHEEVQENGEVSREFTSSSEPCNSGSESIATREERGGAKPESQSLPGFSPIEESKHCSTADVANDTQFEKQKNMGLWGLVYKHMVSALAENDETKPHLDEAGKEEQASNANSLPVPSISNSCQNFSEINQDMEIDNKPDDQKVELQRIEAIKLVEEAIDEILLPEMQDHSTDDQQITSGINPDKELSEEKGGEGGEPFILKCKILDKDSFVESENTDSEVKRLISDSVSTQEEEKTEMKVGKKSNQQITRSWSNVKKLILLKRFIKAVVKVRKFNPREPRYLPSELDPEAEKVHLRHQDMDQKKNAEEWMLDYALQQVVAKLTPERKRKVELLVKAFETVTPTIGS